jgi:hypothetical protein
VWTTKNWAHEETVKISQNNGKLPQERPKKLTKYLVFTHPKMAFYFWTRTFGVLKIKAESYKFSVFPKVNIRKRYKKLTKCLVFNTPKWLLFLDQDIWRLQKTRQNLTNSAVLPKVNIRKRPKTLHKALIFMHLKSTKYL